MELNTIRVADKLASAGVKVPYMDAKLLLASTHSKEYKAAREKYLKQARAGGKTSLSSEEAQGVTVAALAEAILIGWENITLDGAVVPYSRERAKEILTLAPIFCDDVALLASDIGRYSIQAEKLEAEKLGEGSGGN